MPNPPKTKTQLITVRLFRGDPAAPSLATIRRVTPRDWANRRRESWVFPPEKYQRLFNLWKSGACPILCCCESDGTPRYLVRFHPDLVYDKGRGSGLAAHGVMRRLYVVRPFLILQESMIETGVPLADLDLASFVMDLKTLPPWERVEGDPLTC